MPLNTAGLTPLQIRTIWLIWAIFDERQRSGLPPPTVRELRARARERLGVSSRSTIWRGLCLMEQMGILHNAPLLSRARALKRPFNEWLGD